MVVVLLLPRSKLDGTTTWKIHRPTLAHCQSLGETFETDAGYCLVSGATAWTLHPKILYEPPVAQCTCLSRLSASCESHTVPCHAKRLLQLYRYGSQSAVKGATCAVKGHICHNEFMRCVGAAQTPAQGRWGGGEGTSSIGPRQCPTP